MKKTYLLYLPIIISCLFLSNTNAVEKGKTFPLEKSDKIISKIYEKYIPIYKKYIGVESLREVYTEEYDTKKNKLISTSKAKIIRNDYYYKKAKKEVLEYWKNDEKLKPSDYKSLEFKPMYPVFDEKGKRHYETIILGYKKIIKKICYEIDVIPKKKSKRFFTGKIYCNIKNLEIVYVDGTMAKLFFPVKEFDLKMTINHQKDLPFVKNANIILRIYVPLFYPEKRYLSEVKVLEAKPFFNE